MNPQKEQEILKFWKDKDIFNKLREKNKNNDVWNFLDGPITANNPMGVHHAWGRTYKDVFPRYKAMQGFHQRFQSGFDCQGLWVEVEVEKELGFKSKKDIEAYGIEKFIEKCKERVLKYSKIQTDQSIRLGMWADWDNSYFTMSDENNYSIWHFLKKCKEKDYLYKGRDSVPWCPRCGTAISQHEILTEEYKELTHQSIFFKLPVVGEKNTYFLVWTTTPWTLPGNVALAVHPDLDYVKTKIGKDTFILLKEKADLVEGGEIIEEIKGKDLENMEYEGLFDDLEDVKQTLGDYVHKVILWDEVTQEEGTGIVHIAPGCGAEDFKLSRELKFPAIDLTNQDSQYREGFGELAGKFVGGKVVREWIFENLKTKDHVFKIEDYTHRYPTCWRCKSELIFRVVDEWYIRMDELRPELKKSVEKIQWLPGFCKEREIDWLNNMHDWLISKKRYWGLALPIFECECGNVDVMGSKQELKERAVEGWEQFEGKSPHRPSVDDIKIKCSKCGVKVSRIKDVGTPWLDAGIVPFSTMSDNNKADNAPYFHNKREEWQKWFPVDLVTESFPGQFKNWFYVLLVMSQVLENTLPFKSLLGFASVVDEKGEEMHKSKGNAIWFDTAVEEIGADVMRWMYLKQNPANNMRFGFNIAKETRRKLLTLWNSYTYFKIYTPNVEGFPLLPKSKNILDKWIISKFNGLIQQTTENLDGFKPDKASQAIEDFFINDLSLWFIRRSRDRFQDKKEKPQAEQTLYYVLFNLTKLMAPMLPFLAEEMYQGLKTKDTPESVHLCDFPKANNKLVDQKLEQEMEKVRNVVTLALSKRTEFGLKVRQPLSRVIIKEKVSKDFFDLIASELNVKKVETNEKAKQDIEFDTKLTKELIEEGTVRELVRNIQALRKKASLTPQDNEITIHYTGDKELAKVLENNKKQIIKTTKSKSLKQNKEKQAEFIVENEFKINDKQIWLALTNNK